MTDITVFKARKIITMDPEPARGDAMSPSAMAGFWQSVALIAPMPGARCAMMTA